MTQNTGGTIVTLLLGTVHPSPPPKKGGNPTFVPGRWRIDGWDSAPGSPGFVFGWGS